MGRTLNGRNGFSVDGLNAQDNLGFAVSSAGDVNNDGIMDAMVGAPGAGANDEGEVYIIYGNRKREPSFSIANLNAETGIVIKGKEPNEGFGSNLLSIGDGATRDLVLNSEYYEGYYVYGQGKGDPVPEQGGGDSEFGWDAIIGLSTGVVGIMLA